MQVCHTSFSLRYGVLTVEQLLDEAAAKDQEAVIVADINNTSASLEFVRLARERGLRPVLGIEYREEGRLRYIGIAENTDGWRELCGFLSVHLHRSARNLQGRAPIRQDKRKEAKPPDIPKAMGPDPVAIGEMGPGTVLPGPMRRLEFPDRAPDLPFTQFIYPFSAFAPGGLAPGDLRENEHIGIRPSEVNRLFTSPCRQYPAKLVALNVVTFRHKVDFNTHRLLRAIDRNILLSKQDPADLASPDEVMLNPSQMKAAYETRPELLANAHRLLAACTFNMSLVASKNKVNFCATREVDRAMLSTLTWQGFERRYGPSNPEARLRVEKELEVIDRLGFASYYLVTWDLIQYAKARGFYHVGRGSGANSVVAYCTGITDVDPIELNLYFERFLNPHRTSPPDFDIDFSWRDRDAMIEYMFKRHGMAHTALLATYNTFKGRSIIRELGKVFGLPPGEIDALVTTRHTPNLDDGIVRLIYRYGKALEGLPNHLGIHAGGILITEAPICSYTATELPPKGFPTVQFDMIVAEESGLYKFDILSQRGLGHIRDAAAAVRSNLGVEVGIDAFEDFKRDPKIADMLRFGKTIGCFYVESPAMRQLLGKLQCDDYPTLVAASSVIRPGVAQSGMMKQYIERHRMATGIDPVPPGKGPSTWYLHPVMEQQTSETYGVMVYQEDVIKVGHYFGGLDLGEADILRRAMSGKYRSRNQFDLLRDKFYANCEALGHTHGLAAEVWRQMESFSGYSFCKAHSASYAVESYQSLHLKAYYPREFMVGVINNFGGFYRTEVYLHEARKAGAILHAPCVNHSIYLTSLTGVDLWLGFVHVNGLGNGIAETIVAERIQGGPYRDLNDLLRRVPLGLEQATILIRIGALRFTGKTKKTLLWEANLQTSKGLAVVQKTTLFDAEDKAWQLPPLPDDPVEDAYDQLELLGFILPPPEPLAEAHVCPPPPFGLLANPLLTQESVACQMPGLVGKRATITGYLVTTKEVRTIKGDRMCFADFIDVEGAPFDATLFPDVYRRFSFLGLGVYRLIGRVTDDFGIPSLEVEEFVRLEYKEDPRRA